MNRCPWCLINELEIRYHDEEWGVPVHDDQKQFEYLMMEVMQCGLSWDKDCHCYGQLIGQYPVEYVDETELSD